MRSARDLREEAIYAWLKVPASGYGLSRYDRSRLGSYGRHVLAQYSKHAVAGRVSDYGFFADRMLATGAEYVKDSLPAEAVAGMLVACLGRLVPAMGQRSLARLRSQATEFLKQYEKGVRYEYQG